MQANLKIFFLSFLLMASCSGNRAQKVDMLKDWNSVEPLVGQIIPKWFKTPRRFQLEDAKGELASHLFWDVTSDLSAQDYTAHVVISTPAGSPNLYSMDLLSGQLYTELPFCSTRDLWGKYSPEFNGAPVSLGHLPRIIDQTGHPQKVIVFGNEKHYQQYYQTNYFDVRIIGGVVEQECYMRLCRDAHGWKERLVLVAVPTNDKKWEEVVSISDLKQLRLWDRAEAFLENQQGVDYINEEYYPAFKLGTILAQDKAINFVKQNSIHFTSQKIKRLKASCYKLYDHWWDTMQNKFQDPEKAQDVFYKKFRELYLLYGTKMATCARYVYPSNIQDNYKRHWFLTYIQAFHLLQTTGNEYNCPSRTWDYNPLYVENKNQRSLEKHLLNCNELRMLSAFDSLILYIKGLRGKGLKTIRYIDYDKGSLGTHNKLYSWVPSSGRAMRCDQEKMRKYEISQSTFPDDIRFEHDWIHPFMLEKEFKKKSQGIIK